MSPSQGQAFKEALATGGSVQIPLDKYLTDIAPHADLANPLSELVRFEPDGLSLRELTEHTEAEIMEDVTKRMSDIEASEAQEAATDVVRTQISERLNAINRFTPEANDQLATLTGAFYATMAERLGTDTASLFERHPLNIVGEGIDGGGLNQALKSSPPRGWVHATDGQAATELWLENHPTNTDKAVFWTHIDSAVVKDLPELSGYSHSINASAMHHIKNGHANVESELSRGQIPVTADDMALIPDIVSNPDAMRTDLEGDHRAKRIAYVKRYDDNIVLYVEQASKKKRDLHGVTMWKYPSTNDVQQILENAVTPALYVRNERGHEQNNTPPDSDSQGTLNQDPASGGFFNAQEQSFNDTAKAYGGEAAYQQAKAGGNTDLTYRQWVQVRTPEFKAWFGDWENDPDNASKVVNPKTGEPLVVYHYTEEQFSEFKLSKARQSSDVPAFFFTTDPDMGMEYGNNEMQVFLNIRNMTEKPSITTEKDGKALRDELIQSGYDGTIVDDSYDDYISIEYAAFHPNQIKSAVANTGGFNVNSNSILNQDPALNGDFNALEQSFAETAKQYGGKAAYQEAKDAGQTKLTYKQWVQVRTPEFKAWFGDWENAAHRQFLDGEAVAQMRGDEIQTDEQTVANRVAKWYRDKHSGRVSVNGVGEILLNKRAVKDSLSHGLGRDKYAAFAAVPDVLTKGRIIKREPLKGERAQGDYIYFAAPVRIRDRDFIEVVAVKATPENNRMYVHEVGIKEELQRAEFSTGLAAQGQEFHGSTNAGAIKSVLQQIYRVKPDSVSKVVDEQTGEPKIMYHGTPEHGFDTFSLDADTLHGRGEGEGFYFIEDKSIARKFAGRGGRIIGAFLNLKKPFNGLEALNDSDRKAFLTTKSDKEGYDLIGVDGFIVGSQHIVRHPNQIKSATDNTGAFSAESGNILYQSDIDRGGRVEPIATLRGDEIAADLNADNVVEMVRGWYKSNLQGKVVHREGIGDIRITGKSWKKIKRGLPTDITKAQLIPAIPDVLQHGDYKGRFELEKERNDGIVAFHHITALIKLNGDVLPVGVSIGEDKFGNLVYNPNHHPDELRNKKVAHFTQVRSPGLDDSKGSTALEQSIEGYGLNINILNQNTSAPRGQFHVDSNTIALLKDADLSTFQHELGHFFLESLITFSTDLRISDNAVGGGSLNEAQKQVLRDVNAVMNWFGTDIDTWQRMSLEERRAMHEQFARGFEAYLFEGNAPSLELQSVFQRMRSWMINIYRSLKNLNVKLNDDIRQVYDRLLAADNAIKLAEQNRSIFPSLPLILPRKRYMN